VIGQPNGPLPKKKPFKHLRALGCITTILIEIHVNMDLQEGMVNKGIWCKHLHAPKHLHGAM